MSRCSLSCFLLLLIFSGLQRSLRLTCRRTRHSPDLLCRVRCSIHRPCGRIVACLEDKLKISPCESLCVYILVSSFYFGIYSVEVCVWFVLVSARVLTAVPSLVGWSLGRFPFRLEDEPIFFRFE
ncbi:hypothetical protein T439DRAFT_76328 [Meredithblackwellia eburnea MCA 4105]